MIDRFSYSQLNLFTQCQKAWEFRYIDKIKVPVNGKLVRGDAYHKALAFAYSNIVIYKEAPSIDEIIQVYSDTWEKRLRDEIVIDEGEEIYMPSVDFKGKDPGKIKDEGIGLLKLYCGTIMPKVIPVEVEVKKTIIYEGIPIISYMDLIDWSSLVIDHKISSRSFSEDEIDKNLQSSFYGLVLGGDGIDFNIHQALALKRPEIKIISIRRSKDDIDWVGRLVVAAWRQIQAGLFSPSPAGWWCGKEQCAYWGHCKMPKGF